MCGLLKYGEKKENIILTNQRRFEPRSDALGGNTRISYATWSQVEIDVRE